MKTLFISKMGRLCKVPAKQKEIKYTVDSNGCWNCTSHKPNSNGYPVKRHLGRFIHLSRYVYLTQKGPIPEGLVVRHKCDNPLCINLGHLELGTQLDNIYDMLKRGRRKSTFGANNPRARLTEKSVVEIINLFRNGGTYSEIAGRFNVSVSCIQKIISGKNWKQLQGDSQ
jgi:hypothetical protein